MAKFIDINQEVRVENPDQDVHNLYIYNDFSGYGVTEVMENLLAEFNKVIFKEDVSPLQKWAFTNSPSMNDDFEAVEEVLDVMVTMFITTLEMLHGSDVIGPTSPLPDSIEAMTILFLELTTDTCADFQLRWIHEVIRAAGCKGTSQLLR